MARNSSDLRQLDYRILDSIPIKIKVILATKPGSVDMNRKPERLFSMLCLVTKCSSNWSTICLDCALCPGTNLCKGKSIYAVYYVRLVIRTLDHSETNSP